MLYALFEPVEVFFSQRHLLLNNIRNVSTFGLYSSWLLLLHPHQQEHNPIKWRAQIRTCTHDLQIGVGKQPHKFKVEFMAIHLNLRECVSC